VPLYTYETETKTLEIDKRDTVASRVVPFRCPSRRYPDEIVDLAFGVLSISYHGHNEWLKAYQFHALVGIYHISKPSIDTVRKRIQQERSTLSLV
jgi:hypothetical protein